MEWKRLGEKLMARQIILKENGKIAVWSTVIDDFIYDDISLDDYCKIRCEKAAQDTFESITEIYEE